MAYGDWTINGIPINCLLKPKIDPVNRTITFNCLADVNATGADPRVEIASIQALACTQIHNDDLLNGGTKLQVPGGSTVTIVEKGTPVGDITYKAAIEGVVVEENSYSDQAIEYNIVAHYELNGGAKYIIYTPNYHSYSNITYYEWYYLVNGVWTKANAPSDNGAYGTEIGHVTIVETKQIKKVEVYGSACVLPAALTVDGSVEGTQNWNYQHENNTNQPFQKLTFNFSEGSYPTILILHTSEHYWDSPNHGCWLKWIKITYA